MFVKINLAVRYVLAFALMCCLCLPVRAMKPVDDTVVSYKVECIRHKKHMSKYFVARKRIDCIKEYILDSGKYDEDVMKCKKWLTLKRAEPRSFYFCMLRLDHCTFMDRKNLYAILGENDGQRLVELYEMWGCDCECDDQQVKTELDALKAKFGQDRIAVLIETVQKM